MVANTPGMVGEGLKPVTGMRGLGDGEGDGDTPTDGDTNGLGIATVPNVVPVLGDAACINCTEPGLLEPSRNGGDGEGLPKRIPGGVAPPLAGKLSMAFGLGLGGGLPPPPG